MRNIILFSYRQSLLTVLASLPFIGGCGMFNMPGRSFSGALPAATAEEVEVSENLRRHVKVISEEIGDRNVRNAPNLKRAADYVEVEFRALGYEIAAQEYEAAGLVVKNLDTEIRGSTRADEIIVVGAHYDSVPGCPAANDNGSGVAGLLEIARLLRESKPARTIRFAAFVNEEPPFFQTDLMGSVVYARRCKARGEKIVGMISVETIGYYSDEKGSQKYPAPFSLLFSSKGNFIGFVGNSDSARLVRDSIGSFRRHTSFPSEGIAAPDGIASVGFSDQWSFWQEGYPGLMVTDTAFYRYVHYHEASDTPDKLDYDRMARVVAGLARVVNDLANQE